MVLSPPLAWPAWVATSAGHPSDARHVLWFVTVAVGVLVAGAVGRPRGRMHVGLSVVAVVASVVTLFAWWGSEDETGLFVVGIVLATPPAAVAAPLLLLFGRVVTGRRP